MDTEVGNIRNILLVEDDLRDVELTLAAMEEHHLASKVAVVRKANGSPPNQGRSGLCWLKARARTIGFRLDDLVRTHWEKVWRSLVED